MIKPMINDVQNISGNRNPDRKEPKKWKNFTLLLGPIMFCVLQFVESPKTLSPEAFEILSVAIWMAIWWVSEAVSIDRSINFRIHNPILWSQICISLYRRFHFSLGDRTVAAS